MSICKRLLCAMLCAVLLGGAVGLIGCKDKKEEQQPQTEAVECALTLKEYSITLYEGETYTLSPQKKTLDGEVVGMKSFAYASDRAYVASCENGIIKAVQAGQTYVHVTVDGLTVAVFVTVKSLKDQADVFIRFMEEQLYAEVPVQARVYVKKEGELTEIKDATWSSESEALQVSASGVVTPLQTTESAVVKAKCIVDGEEYNVEKTVSVVEPLYYTISTTQSILASTKTYTGEPNAKYTQTTLTVQEYNLRKDEPPRMVTGAELAVQSGESAVVTTNVAQDGTVTLSAKEGVAGSEKLIVQIVGSTRRFMVNVSVAYALATVADMDKLSLASYVAPTDLALSYVLTNDIDYEGKVLYPIALWKENDSRTVGAQWKYLLDYEGGTYSYVDRAQVGKSGTGLTAQEFINFANGNGINPANTSFTGIFDGNGYAIKNAKLMLAPLITDASKGSSSGTASSVFGCVRGGTVRNVEFDIGLQTPSEAQAIFGNDLSETVIDAKIKDFEWVKDNNRFSYYGATIIYYSENITAYNVYSHITLPTEMSSGRRTSGMLGWAKTATVYNNVAYVENNQYDTKYYGLQGEGNAKLLENNLAVGVDIIAVGHSADARGENGNWWTDKSFAALANLSVGSATKNEISYADTLQSFDESVWDLNGLSSDEAPTLINGCSVR